MELRPGYKQTEAGVIPENWSAQRLSELAELTSSKRIFENDYVPFGIPFYRGKEISQLVDGREIEDVCYITESKYDEIKARFGAPTKGDILVTAVGTLGNVYVVDNDAPFYFKDGNLIWLRNIKTVDSSFLGIQLRRAKAAILGGAIGSSQKALTIVVLKTLQVATPPLPEQRAIAAVLSDVDVLLAKLDQLIAKKRDLKQAAMQQLLTGQIRLPGFSGEWEVKRLGDISPLQRGFDLLTTRLRQGCYPVVYSNGVSSYHDEFMVKGPGVVTGRSGTIGNVHFVEEDFWPHNTSLWVTSFKENSPKFIFYLLGSLGLERFGTGSGVPTLNRNDVHAHIVQIPPTLAEQTAIATILSDMDAEIAALEARRDKTRALKQGMMQELLTGRIRLVPPIDPEN